MQFLQDLLDGRFPLVGSAQSMIVLLGTLSVLGWRLDGYLGATFVISVFSIGELVIINGLRGRR
jgi:hypothetical protein